MIKEHPILFQPPLVKSILDNLKDTTRRTHGLEEINKNPHTWKPIYSGSNFNNSKGEHENKFWVLMENKKSGCTKIVHCPYGARKEMLWVRETFARPVLFDGAEQDYYYMANEADWHSPHRGKWKPNIHMPKSACRLRLKITDIKAERLHSITEESAQREGVAALINLHPDIKQFKSRTPNYRTGFADIWLKIHGSDSWKQNPWVWVITFKKI